MAMRLLLLLTILYTFVTKANAQYEFDAYRNLFKKDSLPFILDEKYQSLNEFADEERLDTNFVDAFMESNKQLSGYMYTYDLYSYYPLKEFDFDGYIGLLYAKIGAAGAREDYYYMAVFDNTGKRWSNELIGMDAGDCGMRILTTAKIYPNLKIEVLSQKQKLNCDTEEVIGNEEKRISYRLDRNGVLIAH